MKYLIALSLCLFAVPGLAWQQGEGSFIRGLGRPTTAAAGGGGGAFATDDFNRADGDLAGDTASGGGTWTDPAAGNSDTELLIGTNDVNADAASDWDAYYHSADPASANYYVQGTVFVTDAGRVSLGPALQVLDHNNWVGCFWDGGEGDWNIRKYVTGTLSLVDDGEVTNPPTTARTVKLTRSGTTYTCTSDGTTVATGTDSSFSNAEKAGIAANFTDTDSTFDNFEAGQ